MSITTTTHLNFRGTAHQALDFYRTVFGGLVTVATYADLGMPKDAPGAGKVVFGQLENEEGFRLMAYDVPGYDDAAGTPSTAGTTRRENGTTLTDRTFFQSVRAGTLEEIGGYWDGLADGGTVIEPLAASAWTPGFGMLTDRFGVTWVLDVTPTYGG
ncbi:VOC family protein [Arthrobacter agilis]|uniref:VOC family protein n=1 Tax=Arthrobacter agilis TaxID=37921 RepID=UPI0027840001|nr:VOC family protein [Arthrobacter agilis]MDQ0736377.1 PhnB protein [Arthrobacter agilis]